MRRSKVQRQEERRERGRIFGKRVKKEEKAEPQRFTVVHTDDARRGKYLWCAYEGVNYEHAERLAAPVPGQIHAYTVIPVDVHRWARGQGEPMTAKAAIAAYKAEEAA